MATNTYVALDTKTISTAVASVTFTSIPQGYTDLVLVANFATSTAGPLSYQIGNGSVDTGSNYSRTCLYGDGSSAASFRESNQTYFNTANASTTLIANDIVKFMNYSNTTTYKTMLDRNNNTSGTVQANVYLWRSTAAIDTIKVFSSSGYNLSVGSTFTIYGIAAASVGAKATGGTIYQDASYFYHVFTGNGTFTPTQSISADVLVVAGGGGGGYGNGAGGGAGGVLAYTSQSLTATNYTCTVGAGGAAGSAGSQVNNGVNSSFGALTAATGGGGGASWTGGSGAAAGNGGSGGGGSVATFTSGGTGSQGNNGGAGFTTGNTGAGGGGGNGSVGSAGGNGVGGNGGSGTNTYSTWMSATGLGVSGFIAAGGGGIGGGGSGVGGSGGIGGGGGGANGASPSTGVSSGRANTGSGGGGGFGSGGFPVGAGGSGVIIIRYAK